MPLQQNIKEQTEEIKTLNCSLLTQLETTLTSFESTDDVTSKQQTCVAFTTQLIHGTHDQMTLDHWWKTMQLCIYYYQVSSIYETISEYLTEAAEEQQTCAELLNDCTDKWTTNARLLLKSMNTELCNITATTCNNAQLYSVTIPALLNDKSKRIPLGLSTEYICRTLNELTTTTSTDDKNKRQLTAQQKLTCEQPEDEAAMIVNILKNECETLGLSESTISNLINIQIGVLHTNWFYNIGADSDTSSECDCEICQHNATQ